MGVTCSLLGHDYGNVQTDREREERGEEVVVTERELRVCSRCGAELVMSENTEVRPVRSEPEDAGSDASRDSEDDASWGTESDTGRSSTGARSGPEVDVDADIGPETSTDTTAESGDAVILDSDEETDSAERGPGEWPDADDTRLADNRGTDDPEEATDDTAADGAESEETEILEAESDEEESTEEADGAEPSPETEADSAESASDWPDPGPGGSEEGFEAPTPSEAEPDDDLIEPEPGGAGAAVPSSDSEPTGDILLTCDSCDFVEGAVGSSHRSGDICPECKRGYLEEQSR